jgi:hypothetical protein
MAPGEPGTRYHKKSNLENPDTNGRDPASPPRWPGNNIMIVRIGLGRSGGWRNPPGIWGAAAPSNWSRWLEHPKIRHGVWGRQASRGSHRNFQGAREIPKALEHKDGNFGSP